MAESARPPSGFEKMNRTILATLFFYTLCTTAFCDTVPAIGTTNIPQQATWEDFGGSISGATVGWSFTVGAADVSVVGLGIFDAGGDGLANPHQVGIWDASQNLVASVNVPAGTVATLLAGYRFQTINPVTLSAGQQYVIGAFYPPYPGAGDSATVNDQIIVNSSQTFSPLISFDQSRQNALSPTETFGYPGLDAGLSQGVFGPNFEISVSTPVRLQSFSVD